MAYVRNPVVYVPDLTNGRPIVDGKVYLLTSGTIPPMHDSTIDPLDLLTVTYINEAGNTVEQPQPLYTSKGGCLYGNFPDEARQFMITPQDYVFAAYNRIGELQYSAETSASDYVETDALAVVGSTVLVGGIEAKELKKAGIFTTTAEIASGAFPVDSVLCVTDRANAIFIVQSGGTVDGKGVISAGGTNTAYFDASSFEEYNPEFFGAATAAPDITAFVQYAINLVGVQDPFAANPTGITIKFPSKSKFNVTGTLLLPSYVRIDLNGSTLLGDGTNTMFETAYWSSGALVTNFGQANETKFVLNTQVTNGRISNCKAFKLFNFCESSIVENIRFFGCNQAVYALRCFYGSFRQLHARSPLDGLVLPCFHFESAMGALEAAQVYANGYNTGLLIAGNKDNMMLSNFSSETCPVGISIENTTSAITFERGYFEGNFNSISLASTANHENVVVDGCWFLGTTNAIEATTALSGTFRENNVLNGANVSLQNNFSCRMTVEIPTDVTANNAVYAVPSNYLLGRANNVKYIKQVYDSATGLVEAKCDVYAGPIPRNYAGTSGKPIPNQIPFCTHTFTATTLTIDTKIEYQNIEFIGLQVSVNGVNCGGIAVAGVMLNTIASSLTITPSNNGGFYRFVISGFTGGTTFSGAVKIL
jgi:hypothetical protein